jgi:hypothetical protein
LEVVVELRRMVAAVLLVVLVGCGAEDEVRSAQEDRGEVTTTEAPSTTATEAPSTTATEAPSTTTTIVEQPATDPRLDPSVEEDEDGDIAVWGIGEGLPTRSTEAFTASVYRLECSGGETGEVLPPDVSVEETKIVVTFSVKPLPEGVAYTCQGNPSVPYLVELGEPVGERELVDGACLSGEAVTTSFCLEGPVRWSP